MKHWTATHIKTRKRCTITDGGKPPLTLRVICADGTSITIHPDQLAERFTDIKPSACHECEYLKAERAGMCMDSGMTRAQADRQAESERCRECEPAATGGEL